MNRKNRWILYVSFGAYVLFMLWLLFGQRMQAYLSSAGTENFWNDYFSQKINLIPLRTISEFWNDLHGGGRSHAFINLAGNVIMFVPLGFFIPCIFRKGETFRRSMLYALIIILSIEIVQLATLLGSLDIDDVLLNMIGAVIGYGIFMIPNRKRRLGKNR